MNTKAKHFGKRRAESKLSPKLQKGTKLRRPINIDKVGRLSVCSGSTQALLDAERTAAPEEPVADEMPKVTPVPGTITIRRASIETENMQDLDDGIISGQVCGVDLLDEGDSRVTSHDLAYLIASTMKDDEPSEAFNVGFIVGLVDALLRARKSYPREW